MFTLVVFILVAILGFMTGLVYRQTNTSAEIFKPDPGKVFKIFLWVLGAGTALTLGLSWYASRQLSSSGIPVYDSDKFQNIKSVMIFVMNIFFFALVLLANIYSLARKKLSAVAYLLCIAFFAIFVLKDAYFVTGYYSVWQKSLKLLKGNLPDIHSTAWLKCWLGACVTAFNALMAWWALRK